MLEYLIYYVQFSIILMCAILIIYILYESRVLILDILGLVVGIPLFVLLFPILLVGGCIYKLTELIKGK